LQSGNVSIFIFCVLFTYIEPDISFIDFIVVCLEDCGEWLFASPTSLGPHFRNVLSNKFSSIQATPLPRLLSNRNNKHY